MSALSEFVGIYINSPGTFRAYRAALIDYLSYIYGVEREGRRATGAEIARYEELSDLYIVDCKTGNRDHIRDLEKYAVTMNGHSIVPTTAHFRISVVKVFFACHQLRMEWNERKRIIQCLGKGYNKPRPVTKVTVLDKERIKSILSHCDIRGRAFALVLVSSGMRIGEALQLHPGDIDVSVSPGLVHIRGDGTRTGPERYTFISREAGEALQEWLKVRDRYIRNARARGYTRNASSSPCLFAQSKTTAYHHWDNAVMKSGLFTRDGRTGYGNVKLHSLRKFFRSNMSLKISPDIVDAWTGDIDGLGYDNSSHFTPENLAGEYRRGEYLVTIFGGEDIETKEKMKDLAAENLKLRAELERMNQKMEGIARKFMKEKVEELGRAVIAGRKAGTGTISPLSSPRNTE